MELSFLLAQLHTLRDLPRLFERLGYTPEWAELPARVLCGGPAAVVARRGEFAWYGLEGADGRSAGQTAARLFGRGHPGGVAVLQRERRMLSLAAADAPALDISLDAPDPLDAARLARCAARTGEAALATVFRVADALASTGVDERFFKAFRHTLDAVSAALPGGVPPADRHTLALLQLTRILFLYFVEAKGWLGGRPRFLREEVDRCLGSRRSLQRHLLQPLFFGTLNRPPEERSRLAQEYGAVPFLNGGLFEPHPLERRWSVHIPTPVLRDAFDGLFERFHFTLTSGSAEAVAPDMLGRVFERVMEPGERHATGSYYTPAALVDAVLRDALATWISRELACSWTSAQQRLQEPDGTLLRRFERLRVLDPAAGSGAFLLGALRLLAGPEHHRRAARLRRVVAASLFGVDRNAAAIRLAELRLWLEVVGADPAERSDEVQPLPNLDCLIRQGDSLVDPSAGLPLGALTRGGFPDIRSLRAALVHSTGPAKKHALRALHAAERTVAEALLRHAGTQAEADIASLLSAGKSPTLFGDRRGLSRAERQRLQALRQVRRRAREQVRSLGKSGELPWFHYRVQFADVFARGGFDLVVGNPPWVRAEALPANQRAYLAERFRWFRGGKGRPGFSHQPDVAVAFVERSLELLTPGGVAALLVPSKIATTGYASVAREALARTTTIAVAANLRRDPRAGFDATVYPMALITTLAPPPQKHRVRLTLGATKGCVTQSQLGAGPWELVTDDVSNVVTRLRRDFPALGHHVTCHLGVKTGLNRVFLDPPEGLEPSLIRWALRGRDVRAFRVRRRHRLLWPCDRRGNPLDALPDKTAEYLAGHREELSRRADQQGGKYWTLFRTRAASGRFRVIWSDLADRLRAAALLPPRDADAIPLNSCYVIEVVASDVALALSAWLNCTWCRHLAALTADPASNDFFRFNARTISALPVPAGVLKDTPLAGIAERGAAGHDIQEELDDRCAGLLGLAAREREILAGLDRARAAARG